MAALLAAMAQDLPEILALQKLAYRSEAEICGDYSIPPLTQTIDSLREDFRRQIILKAIEDGRIVGSVRAYEEDGTCYIGRVIVHPDRQNRGLGTKLMEAIETLFPAAKRFELFTGEKSLRNLHFYGKFGYRPFKNEFVHDGLTLVYLEKTVEPDGQKHDRMNPIAAGNWRSRERDEQ